MQNLLVLSSRFLLPLILIGIGTSIWSLFSQSIRLDEAQSIWVSSKPIETIIMLTASDVHVPLYGMILHFWMQIFGNTIISARILSMIFFLLTLPVLYLFVKEASNKQIALLCLALFTLSPFIMWYTSEARMYTLFTLVTSLNHLFFLRMIRSDAKNGKLGYFASLILGFYTHYFFIFLVATQGLYTIGVFIYRKRDKITQAFVKKTLFVMFMAVLFFLPWVYLLISTGTASNTQPLIPPPTSYNIIQTFVNFLFGFQAQGVQAVLVSLWPLSVMTLFFVFTKRKRIPISGIEYIVLASFLPIMLVFVISFFRPIFLSRYLIVVTPTLFFLLAWMLTQYSKKTASIIITTVLVAMLGLMFFQTTSAATPVRENYQGVTNYLEQQATPRDIIAVSAPFTLYPIEYSYSGTTRITTIPEWNRYESGAIPPFSLEALDTQMQQYRTQYERIFVVLSYDQGYEDDIREYFDAYELLEKRNLSEKLEIRTYKLRYN
ncbi:MAG: glycosyltransferase family 39 protein [Candidatus Levybacteria bacterium]|nr:glycosyltransferase family 39 protein [Candidatus Levybacteria bacterium]